MKKIKYSPDAADKLRVLKYLFVSRNYVFYRIEDEYIRIINIYNEKEDFMWQLFGIHATSQQDTIGY